MFHKSPKAISHPSDLDPAVKNEPSQIGRPRNLLSEHTVNYFAFPHETKITTVLNLQRYSILREEGGGTR